MSDDDDNDDDDDDDYVIDLVFGGVHLWKKYWGIQKFNIV